MHKIITSEFEIDLSGYDISFNEENSWFSDTFFTKYSYPFDLIITDEINRALGDIVSHDSRSGKRFIECKYVFYNRIESAVLVIEEVEEEIASVSLRYGMDEFPNFEKSLSELNLINEAVPNIYWHAEQYIYKKYPEVAYNFPQIHTDKYDGSTTEFNGFENIINNRRNGQFLANTVEVVGGEDVIFNRNIIQPMPYLMYVLRKIFELSGLDLKGDIVSDSLLNKILIFAEKDPFLKKEMDPFILMYSSDDVDENTLTYEIPDGWTATPIKQYIPMKEVVVDVPGKYNIIGQIDIRTNNYRYPAQIKILKDNEVIFTKDTKFAPWTSMIDIDFILPSGSCTIKFVAYTAIGEFQSVVDLQILPVYFINDKGEMETNLLNEDRVNLNRTVPNITAGALVTATLNLFNYDIDSVTSREVYINRIEKSIKQNEIIDISDFENIKCVQKGNHSASYLFKYDDEGEIDLGGFYIDSKESVFVTKDTVKKPETTISIPIYPLQNELIKDRFTAKSVQSSEDKICFVLYDGLVNGTNLTAEPTALTIANLVSEYHYSWLFNRVNCTPFSFSFDANVDQIMDLNTKKRLFYSNNIHLVKSITKTQLGNEKFNIEIESENLL